MAPRHKDRLTAVDASFLAQEGRASHMHVGAILLFEGPPPSHEELLEDVESRLHLVPRYRQKLAFPPFQAGRPVWIDDPSFNLEYHVRHTALPNPGSTDQLRALAGRIYSQRLDRSKPLWETWLVQGLEGNSFALITKTHHSMVDGISGLDLASVLFDVDPVPRHIEPEPWTPQPLPSTAELVAEGVRDFVNAPLGALRRGIGAVQSPSRALHEVREAAEGLGEVAWANLNPAPELPLNVEIGPHRRIRWVRSTLADFKRAKNELGGTVNDVVLTVVAGALRRWLTSRGVRTEGLELRALVPVSIRTEADEGALGNRIAAMRGPLPVYVDDPVERLNIVREAMEGLKESKQALGAEVIAGLSDFAPPTILAQASRLNFSTRLFNLIVTNVPGPQFPLYMHGRELRELVPLAFLPDNHALALAIVSYNGALEFGLLADYDAMPDLDFVAEALEESLQELLAAAGEEPAAPATPEPAGTGS
ncbi:MAG: wax ester/triacylglycerol synthase family O-acyltransferase [Actinobacteria bacterium]|nr:MAG: wax ester/triacylglycerol synthase family O-acyltransferase [Actinomycetota bacterium]